MCRLDKAAGVRQGILLRTGRGTEQLLQPPPGNIASHLIFDNLPLAFDAIFAIDNTQAIDA